MQKDHKRYLQPGSLEFREVRRKIRGVGRKPANIPTSEFVKTVDPWQGEFRE
jgi:hypothetical protein